MRIGIDAGCLGIREERFKGGIYRMGENVLKNLAILPNDHQFFLYSCYPISKDILQSLDERFFTRVIGPQKGWLDFAVPRALLTDRINAFWALSQALPIFLPVKKNIVFVHDLAYEYYPSYYSSRMIWRSRYSISKASRIVTFAQATRKDIKKFVGNTGRISVIFQGYEKKLFYQRNKKQVQRVLKKYQLKQPYILYVGAIKPIKNISRLIKIFEQLQSIHKISLKLVMVGNKEYNFNTATLKNVRLLGFMPDDDLPCLYSGARCLLQPSLYEGFGHPVVEAMACGCPAIVSNRGSLPEIAADAAIIVSPTSEKEITEAIHTYNFNDNLRQKKVVNGFGRLRLFSWKYFTEKVLELSESL